MTNVAESASGSASPAPTDLRRQSVDEVISRVETGLGVRLDRGSLVRKRRSVGGRTDRGTWVRVEARSVARIEAQGQTGNGMEAVGTLRGVARPEWYRAMSWRDTAEQTVWRADEVELVAASPIRSGGPLPEGIALPDAWWAALSGSLDNLSRARTTRIATPDTELMTQDLVSSVIEGAFPGQVDTSVSDQEWLPAHADFNWSNLTGPEFWILDWEDYGLAPRGLDSAVLWVGSLSRPGLGERVFRERRADLESRHGRLMALFNCAKILSYPALPEQVSEATGRVAAGLIAELQA